MNWLSSPVYLSLLHDSSMILSYIKFLNVLGCSIHSFSKYLLNPYFVSGSVLDAGDKAVSKTDTYPCFREAYILVGGDSKEISKIYSKSDDVKCNRGRTKTE